MLPNVLRLHPDDSVVTAIRDLAEGEQLCADGLLPKVIVYQPIAFGHKVAIRAIACGEHVIKYGASIGVAVADISPGEHVHTQNLASVRGDASR